MSRIRSETRCLSAPPTHSYAGITVFEGGISVLCFLIILLPTLCEPDSSQHPAAGKTRRVCNLGVASPIRHHRPFHRSSFRSVLSRVHSFIRARLHPRDILEPCVSAFFVRSTISLCQRRNDLQGLVGEDSSHDPP